MRLKMLSQRCIVIALASAYPALAAPADAGAEGSLPKAGLHTVKAGLFRIELELEGVFEAQSMAEVALRPKAWTAFTVLKAVEHGARVQEGDVLVTLDLEKIDEAIADLRREQRLSDLAIEQAENELRFAEKSSPLDLAASGRTRKIADEDLKRFLETGRARGEEASARTVIDYKQSLEYELEELRQLEKMYKADDLTEETEEIVLKRARNEVDRYRYYLDRAEYDHEQTVKVDLPRQEAGLKEAAARSTMAEEHLKLAVPLAQRRREFELKKLRLDRDRSNERLEKLLADRAAMAVRSPASGIVYYGACTAGKWSDPTAAGAMLERGGSLIAEKVFMTVVKPRPVFIRATVPEAQLNDVRAGLKGSARPTGHPDLRLAAIVDRLDPIPRGPGVFGACLTVALGEKADALMPGMTCKVKLVAYEKKDAIAVPQAAVRADEREEEKHHVYVAGKDGKPEKRPVTTGRRTDKEVEILEGLAEGEAILAICPVE